MDMEQKTEPTGAVGTVIVQMVIGALIGFGGLMLFDKTVGMRWLAENMTPTGVFALLLAGVFIIIGTIVLILSFSKTLFTYNQMNADMGDEEFAETRPINRWSAIGLFFYAGALILLALGNSTTDAPQYQYFWGVVGCMAAQLGVNGFLWLRYDELWKQVTKEASAISFVIIEVALFIWAGAAVFGLGVSFDPLAVVVASTGLFLFVSMGLTIRKGMAY